MAHLPGDRFRPNHPPPRIIPSSPPPLPMEPRYPIESVPQAEIELFEQELRDSFALFLEPALAGYEAAGIPVHRI